MEVILYADVPMPDQTYPPCVEGDPPPSGNRRQLTGGPTDQVKRVRLSRGASPPGRRPRRTTHVGCAAPLTSASRSGPSPSRCHRSDKPTTRTPAPSAAETHPFASGRRQHGSVAIPTARWIATDAWNRSRLASLLPASGKASAPMSRSGRPRALRVPRAELDGRPVVLGPSEGNDDRPRGGPARSNEQRDVAGSVREDASDVRIGEPVTDERLGRVNEQQDDVLLRRQPDQVLTRPLGGEGRGSGGDTALLERRAHPR